MEFNHYQVLGVPRNASIESIKKAYKALAKKYHPDINPGSKFYEDHFKKVTAAYAILSDPLKRQQYDVKLHRAEYPPIARPNPARPAAQQRPRRPAPKQPPLSVNLGMPSKQNMIVIGMILLLIAGGYVLFHVMNRFTSNNHYELGLECEQKRDYAGAMYYYQQGIEMDNSNYKIQEHLANLLVAARPEFKESYLQAAYLYASVLQHKKENKDTLLYKLAQCYLQLNESNKALVALEEIKPSFNDTTMLLKGECYIKNKQWNNALLMYDEFLSKNSNSDLAHQKSGYAHYKNIEFEKAKEQLDKAILLNPANGATYYIRGLVSVANADTLDACRDFDTASQLQYEGADRALYQFCQTH
jgi:tetratricopeptide (TPR) repeat protein